MKFLTWYYINYHLTLFCWLIPKPSIADMVPNISKVELISQQIVQRRKQMEKKWIDFVQNPGKLITLITLITLIALI